MSSTPPETWASIYDAVHAHRKSDVAFYVGLAREIGGPVLELGCGTGRIAIPIARAGRDIVGLDNDPAMLSIARRSLKAAGPLPGAITLRRGDTRTFRLSQRFSLAIVPFNAFLLLLSPADQRQALRRIHDHLLPGGVLALDIFVPDLHHLDRDDALLYHLRDVTDPTTGRRFALWSQSRYDHHQQMIAARLVIEEVGPAGVAGQRIYHDWQMRYVHRYEMQYLLELAGFQVEELYGDFDGSDFEAGSERMVWVARRG